MADPADTLAVPAECANTGQNRTILFGRISKGKDVVHGREQCAQIRLPGLCAAGTVMPPTASKLAPDI